MISRNPLRESFCGIPCTKKEDCLPSRTPNQRFHTEEQSGNLVLFKHSQHLELDARLLGLNAEIFGVSRSHNSPIMNKLQTQGRLSSVQATADKNKPRKFLTWLK